MKPPSYSQINTISVREYNQLFFDVKHFLGSVVDVYDLCFALVINNYTLVVNISGNHNKINVKHLKLCLNLILHSEYFSCAVVKKFLLRMPHYSSIH